nr:transcriptional regulator SpvR [Salmonella enterica subsp. enterica serovar Enteritidis str. 642044 8-1]
MIISALTISGQKTNIMGRAVNSQIIEELCQTNNCIVISARNYFHRESLVCRTSVEGGVMLFIPKNSFSAANLISTGWPEHLYFFMRGLKILIWTPYTIFLNRH